MYDILRYAAACAVFSGTVRASTVRAIPLPCLHTRRSQYFLPSGFFLRNPAAASENARLRCTLPREVEASSEQVTGGAHLRTATNRSSRQLATALRKASGYARKVFVQQDLAGLIEDTEVHGTRMEVDAAVVFVLPGVESHRGLLVEGSMGPGSHLSSKLPGEAFMSIKHMQPTSRYCHSRCTRLRRQRSRQHRPRLIPDSLGRLPREVDACASGKYVVITYYTRRIDEGEAGSYR